MFKEALLFVDRLKLRHYDPTGVAEFDGAYHGLLVGSQAPPELLLCHL